MIGSSVEEVTSGQACQFGKEDALDQADPKLGNARLQVGAAECLFRSFIHPVRKVHWFQGRVGRGFKSDLTD